MDFDDKLRQRAMRLREAGLWRVPRGMEGASAGPCLDLTSNDYLGLAGLGVSRETLSRTGDAPESVSRETLEGSASFSAGNVSRETDLPWASVPRGAASSRVVRDEPGNTRRLEQSLAEWLGYEASLIFASGYAANVGVLGAIVGPHDRIVSDALNHASLIDGCRLAAGETVIVPHNDLSAVLNAVQEYRGRGSCWVVTESYFSMEADSPNLREIARICREHSAELVVDESHALGVFGPEGRGICAEQGIVPTVLVSGLGKAFGAQGGFVVCSQMVRSWLWNRARTHFFSTGISPILAEVVADSLARVRQLERERRRLADRSAALERVLNRAGWQMPEGRHGPLFPLIVGSELRASSLARRIRGLGLGVQEIRPPTVPAGACRLRFALRADLSEQDLVLVAKILGDSALAKHPENAAEGFEASMGAAAAFERQTPQGPERWVVLGCGTNVGKTFVSEALVRGFRSQGRAVVGLKPIETGVPDAAQGFDVARTGDAACLAAASTGATLPSPHPLYAYEAAVTPARAARQSGKPIDLAQVSSWVAATQFEATAKQPVVVLETAGGVFSPLGSGLSNLDLAVALGDAQWILVAVDRIGVLHEVCATLRAMHQAGAPPDWIVLTSPEFPDQSTGTNEEELRQAPELHRYLSSLILLDRDDPSNLRPLLELDPGARVAVAQEKLPR